MDLNLVRIFSAVYEQGSVTGAAQQLHLTQPSVTQALNRLRRETKDELFTRSGRGISPTRAATQLYGEIGHVPLAVDTAVKGVYDFDPLTSGETFRIALTDLGQAIFLPTLIPALLKAAPRAVLDVINLDILTASEDLMTGRIDIAVASTVLPGRLRSLVIRSDVYGCVGRLGRFGRDAPTFEELTASPRIIARDTLGHTLVENLLPKPVEGSVYLPAFSTIPPVVAVSDLIAFVPQAVIDSWQGRWELDSWKLPQGTFTALVRGHVAVHPVSAASAWFAKWTIECMRHVPAEGSLAAAVDDLEPPLP